MGGRGLEAQVVAAHYSAVVVEDGGEPGLLWPALPVGEPDFEVLVVGLPDLVWPRGLETDQEIILLLVGFGAFA